VLLLVALAATTPLPRELRESEPFGASVRVLDRGGRVMAEVRADDGARARWVGLDEIGPTLPRALMAAEDRRFFVHPGVDPIAIARAAAQALWHGRIVSGGSTLTQQLARTLVPRPRTLAGKVREAAVALRIEWSLSKPRILESYLNLVAFGPSLRGVEAASRFYFDKPARALSLAEAATLAAMPRGPSIYDPRRASGELRARRDRILDRVLEAGWAERDQVERARREPIEPHVRASGWSAPHLGRGLLSGAIHPEVGPLAGRASEVRTTIDGALQREAQAAARATVSSLQRRSATAAAAVVLDNDSAEVLAWVGSPDFQDARHGGQNDGVLALRQPGSTLKPFVYAVGMEELGWTAATLLPDVDLHIATDSGDYHPHNYDGQYHGPVRLREALGCSYNVPAVHAATTVGPERVLTRLRELGMRTLTAEADHYGSAIALGDGEVRLVDLANAYATLARGGVWLPVRTMRGATDSRGAPIGLPRAEPRRVMDERTAALLLDVLADPNARLSSFGAGSVLELPFEAAVKTGTSKGFRDNLAVGATREVTVAVWVGNFDGSPMQGVSGVTGAGPLWRAVMMAAMEGKPQRPFARPEEGLERVEVCSLSGMLPHAACKHRMTEVFARGTAPERTCDMHVEVDIDRRNGLRAGPGCSRAVVARESFETFDSQFTSWAVAAKRPIPPADWSPLCPAGAVGSEPERGRLAMKYPYPGAVFASDPSLPDSAQGLVLRAEAPAGAKRVRFVLDGVAMAAQGAQMERTVALAAGVHRVWVEAEGMVRSEGVEFEVR
jgi:penicillin-binding protein 1C